ncbi:MAG: hypothetical protein CM15mP39_01760 [Synechococcus sp.]|nr:MAG: hypothetical protein CM15mP39_01760 [Synechococcus sp.]
MPDGTYQCLLTGYPVTLEGEALGYTGTAIRPW